MRYWTPLCFAVLLVLPQIVGAATWQQLDLDATETYARWYRPDSLPLDAAAPVIVFLHGAGATPEAWMPLLEDLAEDGAFILALPKSVSDFGWGIGDDYETLRQVIHLLPEETPIDPLRISLAGHSSGGSFAYVAGLGGRLPIAAVFSLAAPFRTVLEVADPVHTSPVRLYYGTEDPNFRILPPLRDMLERLDVDMETEVSPGFGHNSWPSSTLPDGFAFLLQQTYPGPCVPSATRLCLLDGRFSVELAWRDYQDRTGIGSSVEAQTTDSGMLWFFGEDNWELLVKVLDGCGVNGRYWVFAAAATDIEYTLTVTDLLHGEEVVYVNPLGQASTAINDIQALDTCP